MNRTLGSTFIAIMMLAAAIPATADDMKLTYDDLRSSMSVNNTALLSAGEEYTSALIDVEDAKSNYHPQIGYTVAGSYVLNHQTMDLDLGGIKEWANGQEIKVPPQLPMSPEITIPMSSVTDTLPDSYNMVVDVSDPYLSASISLVQPIYTWGKVTSNVKMNEEIAQAKALQIGDTQAQLDAQLKALLASLYYLEDFDGILQGMKSDADELVDIARSGSEAGVALSQDVAQAQVGAKQLELAIVQVRTQVDTLVSQLETLTGIRGLTPEMIDYVPDEDFYAQIANADRRILELQATGNGQATIQMLDHMVSATQYAQKAADRSMYVVPDIALSVSADYSAPMTRDFVEQSAWGVTVAVALQGTIWDGGQRLNDRDRAESATRSAQIARQQAVDTIRTTLAQNFASIDLALARIDYQDADIAMLADQLAVEETKLEYGTGSRQDVIQKRIELNQAKLDRLTSRITLATSCHTVEYLTGFTAQNIR